MISLLWAMLHIQYDWTGVLQIFVIGLFLGWMRWRSGSLVVTFLLHALFNLEGTLETLAVVHFASELAAARNSRTGVYALLTMIQKSDRRRQACPWSALLARPSC